MKQIKKILIANRGEIACRIIRSCRKLGIETAAVYSDIDSDSVYVKMADEAVRIGSSGIETYLDQNSIIAAAKKVNACAIHPGYGLLSENPDFMSRCSAEGIIFIGPASGAINAMGSKIGARELCESIGVPVIPGFAIRHQSPSELADKAEAVGFPVLIKASAGGGGIGIFLVEKRSEFEETLASARKKSMAIFGDDTLLVEKYLTSVRHIEFQVFGDSHGNVIHCFERECSVQRRHQKMIEESPSPVMNPALRKVMGEAAVKVAHAVNYTGAGTVEFVLDDNGSFYFLEMNTRLQVEHPVTEAVTGLDLVELQIRIAEGGTIGISQNDISINGHSIEVRVYSEDPENNFNPSAGKILKWVAADGVRIDSGIDTGSVVTTKFDPMLAKVIVHADNRDDAVRKMIHSLKNTAVLGIASNIDFISSFIGSEIFRKGMIKTDYFDTNVNAVKPTTLSEEQRDALLAVASILKYNSRMSIDCESVWNGKYHPVFSLSFQIMDSDYSTSLKQIDTGRYEISIDGRSSVVNVSEQTVDSISVSVNSWRRKFSYAVTEENIYIHTPSIGHSVVRYLSRFQSMEFQHHKKESCEAPIDGTVAVIKVKTGDRVEKGQVLITMESMKMESPVYSDKTGTVNEILVKQGDFVRIGTILIDIAPESK